MGPVQWRAGCDRESVFGVLCAQPGATAYYVQNDCQHNQLLAAVNRVATNWPQPGPLHDLRRIAKRVGQVLGPSSMVDFTEWGAKYTGNKRARYVRALESLVHTPINRKDSYIQAFVKLEKLVDVSKDPRMIQARGARFNVALGNYLKGFEHRLYGIRGEGKLRGILPPGRLIVKGMNSVQRAALLQTQWDSMRKPVQLALDCSRFDAHCSVPLLKIEHSVYLSCFRNEPELQRLLAWQLKNVCFTRSGLRYEVVGRRMSGDMNTALGNCVLMIVMLAAAMAELGVPVDQFRMADDGDDCCLMVEHEYSSRVSAGLPAIFLRYGHELKIESVATEFRKLRLCGASPIQVGDVLRMITEPGRAMGKARVHPKVYSGRFLPSYVATVGQCMLAMHAGCPVLQAHALALRRASKTLLRECPGSYLYKLDPDAFVSATSEPVTERAREDFAVAFGMDVTIQLEIEAWFDSLEPRELLRLAPPKEVPGVNYYG